MHTNIMNVKVGTSMDAEVQAIEGIPQLLENLTPARKIAVLLYLADRVKSGDTFGK